MRGGPQSSQEVLLSTISPPLLYVLEHPVSPPVRTRAPHFLSLTAPNPEEEKQLNLTFTPSTGSQWVILGCTAECSEGRQA